MPAQQATTPSPTPPGGGSGDRSVTLAAGIGAHGVTGEVRLKLFTDDLTPYRAFNNGALTLTSVRIGSKGAIARFAEITDRTAAEGLRGTALPVTRPSLPPLAQGASYHLALSGRPVVPAAGPPAGPGLAAAH